MASWNSMDPPQDTMTTETETAAEGQTLFLIPEGNMPELEAKLAKLARKAAKLHLTPPAVTTLGHQDVPLWRNTKTLAGPREAAESPGADWRQVGMRRYLEIELAGEAPSVPGWDLLAVLEHGDSEVGNVVRNVPGRQLPPAYRTVANLCQHCDTRRNRLQTYVLQDSQTGALKQVGRNCLADFLRNPEEAMNLCARLEILRSAALACQSAGGGVARDDRVGTDVLLALTSRLTKGIGWVSKRMALEAQEKGEGYQETTAGWCQQVYFNPRFFEPRRDDSPKTVRVRELVGEVDDHDRELAEQVIEWVRASRERAHQLNDYEHNLLVVLSDDSVRDKHLGIACSAVAAYGHHLRRQEQARAAATTTHVGTVGKRELFAVTVAGLSYFDGQYGVRVLVRMKDTDGNALVWWTGDGCPLKEGETYLVRGTVKEHAHYKGAPQTVLTRVTEEAPAPAGK